LIGVDIPQLNAILSYAILDLQHFLNTCRISHVGMKVQRDEGGGRVVQGNNTGGGVVLLLPIKFQCVEFRFQLDYLVYTYIVDHVYTQF
jgi:hypothetical protein